MSYSTDPVADAAAHFEPRFAEADAADKAEEALANDFLAAARECDANGLAYWAPKVTDWDAVKHQPRAAGSSMPKRYQLLHECMAESLDYTKGPHRSELMQLLLNVAHSSDVVNAPAQARALLARMALTFATNNTGI